MIIINGGLGENNISYYLKSLESIHWKPIYRSSFGWKPVLSLTGYIRRITLKKSGRVFIVHWPMELKESNGGPGPHYKGLSYESHSKRHG
jgi:hypothetical protein